MKFLLQYNENKVLSSHYRELNKNDFDYMLKRFCKDFDWNDMPIYKVFDNLEQPYYIKLYDYKDYAKKSFSERECWLDSKALLVSMEQK
ncbi:hypothetical protein M0Q97_06610 [Candidatus Dojkabacteria bacterium]|jgi:hypothetical protein|nr:hypothetical protein [Candidatus Dojkabacteria bacterium]